MAKIVSNKDTTKIYALVNTLLGTNYSFSGFGDDVPVATGMFKDAITLFNFHKKTGLWYPTIITDVHTIAAQANSHTTDGINNTDSVEVQITSNAAQNVNSTEGVKSYTLPKEYAETNTPDKYITFTPECDFFIEGRWDSLLPIDDDEYDEGLYNALNATQDGVYMISSATFYGLIPHFEIGGR